MEPVSTTGAIALASTVASGGSTGILLILVLVILPFIVKFWNWTKETSAQGALYSQLSEMVQAQRKELDEMYIQRRNLQEQVFELRGKVEHLESSEATIKHLKEKLDLKDQIIQERDMRITKLLDDLLEMKDKIHKLELRLGEDEAKFCEGCSFKRDALSSGAITSGLS